MCLFSDNVKDYYYVAQGKTEIPGVDDKEEARLTDVSSGTRSFDQQKGHQTELYLVKSR
jgi:myosin heavy chain 6/7